MALDRPHFLVCMLCGLTADESKHRLCLTDDTDDEAIDDLEPGELTDVVALPTGPFALRESADLRLPIGRWGCNDE